MTVNTYNEIDYLAQARERYTGFFKDKPVFDAYVSVLMVEIEELQHTFKDLIQLRSIDSAVGEQLDLLGRIVGQDRTLINYYSFPYFGFDGATGAETFGSVYDSSIGGVFRSVYQDEGAAATVDDETYRFLLKARIIANTTRATPDAVISGINFITGNTNTTILEEPNAHLVIETQDNMTTFQKYFLMGLSSQGSIVPVPIGVTVEYAFFEEDYFGFEEDTSARGFTELATGYGLGYGLGYGAASSDSTIGGYIAKLG